MATAANRCPMRQNANYRMLVFVLLGLVYLILGACIFRAAELENEDRERTELMAMEDKLRAKSNLTESEFKLLINTILKLEPHRYGAQWTFVGAFYFAITVVTTIGYGHCVPHTQIGKLVCVLYAIFGVPLWLITFQSMGERFNTAAKKCLKVTAHKIGCSNEISMKHLIIFGIASTFLTLMIGIIAFANFEEWSYLESAYYSFMTLSTIGFGDYVALEEQKAMQQNVVYVTFSFCYIIVGLTVTGAFLNLTIVRLFMINPDCSGSSSEDKSCETMKMNCDGNFSTSYRSDEESCKENIYETPKCVVVGCDDKTNSIKDDGNLISGCLKDILCEKISSIWKSLSSKICCCFLRGTESAKVSTFQQISIKDKNGLISKTLSPYFSSDCNKNNNWNSQSPNQDTSRVSLTVYSSSDCKDDAKDIVHYTPSPNFNTNFSTGYYNNTCSVQEDEIVKSTSKLNLSVKSNNFGNLNVIAPNVMANNIESFSPKSVENVNALVLPHCAPFISQEQTRYRHQSCSLPNRVHNETETYKNKRHSNVASRPTQYRRTLLTKNTNLTSNDKKNTVLVNKPACPAKTRTIGQLTRHNTDPQRIQEFCRQTSKKISTTEVNE